MAFRDLVMGAGGCSVPNGQSSANPLGGLADSLLGSQSKIQERMRELPGLAGPGQSSGGRGAFDAPFAGSSLPGQESNGPLMHHPPDGGLMAAEFMGRFREFDQQFENAWGDPGQSSHGPLVHSMPGIYGQAPHLPGMGPQLARPGMDLGEAAHFAEFENVFAQQGPLPAGALPFVDGGGPPQQVLAGFLRAFLESTRNAAPFPAVQLPELGLSEGDKCRIRDRSSVMARHLFADRGEAFVDGQVNALLHSLQIDGASSSARPAGPMGGRFREFDDYWGQAQRGGPRLISDGHDPADQWASEFGRMSLGGGPGGASAEGMHLLGRPPVGAGGWADEFAQERGGAAWANEQKMEQQQEAMRSRLAGGDTSQQQAAMAQTRHLVKPGVAGGGTGAWADEFEQLHHNRPSGNASWADEFASAQQSRPGQGWADEFAEGQGAQRDWAQEFEQSQARGGGGGDWADEFGSQLAQGALGGGLEEDESGWLDSYNKGLLSEAVLALEAEVLKNADNSEGWRLLGIAHAENDDDRQVQRVSDDTWQHAAQLEQAEALGYLRGWLAAHPQYGALVPQTNEALTHAEVAGLFRRAAETTPGDADVHTVLGVLYNLSRDYDAAIAAFARALELRPRDYSLWNKLGATQANSSRSPDAISAYRKAVELKPNYVRAWANMGIGYANQGRYEDSIRFYVRALAMNPKADNAWQYLRISLSCAGRAELTEACDLHDLERLQKEYPL
eukprot:jgi/Mesen1/1308/ME000013S00808